MKKIVEIKNEKQLKYFCKMLPIYNSFLYKRTIFHVLTDNSELKIVEIVLNEKKRYKKLDLIITEACRYIDNFFTCKNICGFSNQQCYVQRNKCMTSVNGCCRKCRYQSPKGCQSMNVACKLFFCSEVRKRMPVPSFDDVLVLKCLSFRQRILLKSDYFSSKEEVIKDLYFNSLLIGCIKIVYRLFFCSPKLRDMV